MPRPSGRLLGWSCEQDSTVKARSLQCPGSARVPPQGAPGGSGQLGTPRTRPAHWAPSHGLGCSSEPPPQPPTSPPLSIQARLPVRLHVAGHRRPRRGGWPDSAVPWQVAIRARARRAGALVRVRVS
eukprot:scaffold35523_cov53-Phaeocystis_antarctica.AAC.3